MSHVSCIYGEIMAKRKYADLVLINAHYKNYKTLTEELKKASRHIGLLTQIYVLCHKNHKLPLLPYQMIQDIYETLLINHKGLKIKDHIVVVKTRPQYVNNTNNDLDIYNHALFSLISKNNKYLWRRKSTSVKNIVSNNRDAGSGDVWVVSNFKQYEFPKALVENIFEFSNIPNESNLIKVGFNEF